MFVGSSVLCDGVREWRRLNVQDTERGEVQRTGRCVSIVFSQGAGRCVSIDINQLCDPILEHNREWCLLLIVHKQCVINVTGRICVSLQCQTCAPSVFFRI